ncbi:desumoylating isopeptidase 1 [Entomortierella parvispora]|uniref:Desumoylating isopeptidase 1 n=1 Tax=Entomortierella parvispora TaxID=205924 RepID=A0A9P3HJK7_9FUNG|nr:desumoylating isopeptidase 1 [Entomortierella parvispora]
MSERVTLFVYDLSQGMARTMSMGLMGRQIDAIYHTSVVVFGREFFYGQGIMSAIPGTTQHGTPIEHVDMGVTEIPQEVFMEFMDNMRETFTADAYHLLDNNCNNFSNEVCQFLVGQPIPAHITSLPADFLNTPFGQTMRPMIEGMFGPSRHTPSPVPPSAAPPASLSAPTSLSSLSLNPSSSGTVAFMTDLGQLNNAIQSNPATVVYFTSATCPPCRVIAPIYDELVLSKGKQIFGVKVDIGMAQAIGRAYEVRSTPTFMFFLKGKKFSQFSGANQAELRSSIDLLIYSAHPAHPHALLSLKQYKALSGVPILFSSLSSLDAVFAKLRTFLPTEGGLSQAEVKQLDKIHSWLRKREEAKTNPGTEPSMGELGATWKPLLGKLITLLPYETQFPLWDIIRMLVLHPRVAEVYAKDGNLTLVNMFKNVGAKGDEGSKPVALMTLRVACNGFGTPLLGTYILSSAAREATKQLLVSTLLSTVPQQRQTAASLAFNIGVKIAESRSQVLNVASPTISGGPLEDLEEDWSMECLSAIATAIEKEETEEILHRLLGSVANFIFMEEPFSGAVLMNILGLPETLDKKIQDKIVISANVVGLCREVKEMVSSAVTEQARRQDE